MATKVKIETAKGVMIAELYDNETPITVSKFKKLIGEGFYDGLNFHRVLPFSQEKVRNELENDYVNFFLSFSLNYFSIIKKVE